MWVPLLAATLGCAADLLLSAVQSGATIPTLVTLVIGRPTCLPHSLNPRLVMAMTGKLVHGYEQHDIISVSVSLAEGLVLWTRDAFKAHRRNLPFDFTPRCNPSLALPGGRYSLPLTVSIPTVKLPPSYEAKDGRFSITYNLSISLLCDDPYRQGQVIVLSDMAKPFVMLPVTMPEPARSLSPMECRLFPEDGTQEEIHQLEKEPSWTVEPML